MAATKQTGRRKLEPLIAKAKAENRILVRLKPHAPKKGHRLLRFTAFGVLFEEQKGWYDVDPHVAEYLSKVRATPDDPESPFLAFDVCSPEEASKINNAENELAIRQGKAAPTGAHKVVARDVRSGTDMGPKITPPPGYDVTTEDLKPAPKEVPQRSMRAAKA
jgi:hypothetical protein